VPHPLLGFRATIAEIPNDFVDRVRPAHRELLDLLLQGTCAELLRRGEFRLVGELLHFGGPDDRVPEAQSPAGGPRPPGARLVFDAGRALVLEIVQFRHGVACSCRWGPGRIVFFSQLRNPEIHRTWRPPFGTTVARA